MSFHLEAPSNILWMKKNLILQTTLYFVLAQFLPRNVMRRAYPCSLILNINSFGASVAQERREKVRRDRETNNGRLERTKTLAMLREFSTNKGL